MVIAEELLDRIHLRGLGPFRRDAKVGYRALFIRLIAGGEVTEQGRLAHPITAEDAAQALLAGYCTPEPDNRFLQRLSQVHASRIGRDGKYMNIHRCFIPQPHSKVNHNSVISCNWMLAVS